MSSFQPWKSLADAVSPFRGWPLRIYLALLAVYFAGSFLLYPYPVERFPIPALCPGNVVAGTIPAEFYRLPRHPFAPTMHLHLWGGIFRVEMLTSGTFLLSFGILFAAALAVGVAACRSPRRIWEWAFLVLCLSGALFLSVRMSEGYDEFFINLRHAWVLVHGGGFSANLWERLDATVDVLPFVLAAGLHIAGGIELGTAAILVSLTGTALCIVGAYVLARQRLQSRVPAVLAALLMSVCPPLLTVGGSGFMSPVFAAMFIWAYLLISTEAKTRRFIGYGIVGLMPCVRFEAFAFIVVFWFLYASGSILAGLREPAPRSGLVRNALFAAVGGGTALLVPFGLLCLWQWIYFGSPTPVPVVYKATVGSLPYLRWGFHQFFELNEGYGVGKLLIVLLAPLVLYLLHRPWRDTAFLLGLVAMSLGYYTAGGDWFALQWARYLIPIYCLLIPLFIISVATVLREQPRGRRIAMTAVAIVLSLVLLVLPGRTPNLFQTAVPIHILRPHGDGWARVNRLAILGQWLKETLEPKARIASSELATMMYFAQRDILALLGTANAYGSRTPPQPLRSGPELGKRRYPEVIERDLPEVIVFWEPVSDTGYERTRDLYVDVVNYNAYRQHNVNIAYYFAGSPNQLMRLGYRYIVAAVDAYAFSYWVSAAAYDRHIAAMKRLGAVPDGTMSFNFRVSPQYAETYQAAGVCVRG